MSEQDKKKLCWNCEGSVARHLETCPYCGVYLSPSQQDEKEERTKLAPPYPAQNAKAQAIPKPPFQTEPVEPRESEREEEPTGSMVAPLTLLLLGTSSGLFGLTLWLFSEQGRLTLSWSEDWGPVFLVAALPLLGFGIRYLSRLTP